MKMTKILIAAGMFVFMLGCRGHKTTTPEPVKTQEKAQKKEPQRLNIQKKAATAPKKRAKAEKTAETKKIRPPADISSKKNLEKCYLEIYCAQKNGNMAGLLKIYKKYGFETPKQWTRAYIEAAKDTDWVSELARKASKSCKKKK